MTETTPGDWVWMLTIYMRSGSVIYYHCDEWTIETDFDKSILKKLTATNDQEAFPWLDLTQVEAVAAIKQKKV